MLTNPIKIFVAEDDNDDFMLFQDALNELHVTVELVRAVDGNECMEIMQAAGDALPDIVFLDLNMPCRNGLDCLKEIRSIKNMADMPVIIMSTSSDKNIIENMYASGASLYICKPNDFNGLKKELLKALTLIGYDEHQTVAKHR